MEVKVLGSFNRVKSLSADEAVIVRALKDSSSLVLRFVYLIFKKN